MRYSPDVLVELMKRTPLQAYINDLVDKVGKGEVPPHELEAVAVDHKILLDNIMRTISKYSVPMTAKELREELGL